jgi:hypothetical protein
MLISYHSEILDSDSDAQFREKFSTGTQPDISEGMAQLVEPNGTLSIIVTAVFAIHYCATHQGWTWRQL